MPTNHNSNKSPAARKLVQLNPSKPSSRREHNAKILGENIVGQHEAVDVMLRALERAHNPLRDQSRPVAVIVFAGFSRTGKSSIVRKAALIEHGSEDALLEINGGDYVLEHQVATLIGAPPSYKGFKDPDELEAKGRRDTSSKLTQDLLDASRKGSKSPVSFLLLDEFDRMHHDIDNAIMSIIEGKLDNANGRVTRFNDTIIVMTTNIGMHKAVSQATGGMGFIRQEYRKPSHEEVTEIVKEELQRRYAPEFLNRIDVFVVFDQHEGEALTAICDMEIDKFVRRMEQQLPRGQIFALRVEESAKAFLLRSTREDNNNIAQLKRAIQSQLEDPLGNLLEQKLVGNGDTVIVQHEDGSEQLQFFLDGSSTVISEADTIAVNKETAEERRGLARQRRISRARRQGNCAEEFVVNARYSSSAEQQKEGPALMHDLQSVYGFQVLSHKWASVAPWLAEIEVRGSEALVKTLQEGEPKLIISRRSDS